MQLKKYPAEAVRNKATDKKGLAFLKTRRNNNIGLQIDYKLWFWKEYLN